MIRSTCIKTHTCPLFILFFVKIDLKLKLMLWTKQNTRQAIFYTELHRLKKNPKNNRQAVFDTE